MNSAWAVLGLLLAGALIALVLVAVGVIVANYFADIAYKRYQQGINDGWRAREVRGEIKKSAERTKV